MHWEWSIRESDGEQKARWLPYPKPLLWTAAEQGEEKAVRDHLAEGAHPEECSQGWTPLMKPAEEPHHPETKKKCSP